MKASPGILRKQLWIIALIFITVASETVHGQLQTVWSNRTAFYSNTPSTPIALTIDSESNVYVTGASGTSATTVKYDKVGNQVWAITATDIEPRVIMLDRNEDVYVGGSSLIKYDKNGIELWRVNGRSSAVGHARSIAIHTNGTVYAANGYGAVMRCEQTASNIHPIVTISEGYPFRNFPTQIKIDADGNIYGLKEIRNQVEDPSNNDIEVTRHDGSWNLTWRTVYDGTRYDGSQRSEDYPVSLYLDESGNVVVIGHAKNFNDGHRVIKYNNSGHLMWQRGYTSRRSWGSTVYGTAMDSAGNIYSGSPRGMVKLAPDGTQMWATSLLTESPISIDVDGDGNVYITTPYFSYNSPPSTSMHNSEGTQIWRDAALRGTALKVGPQGEIIVVSPTFIVRLERTNIAGFPTIVEQPHAQGVDQGASATFHVNVTSASPLSFQWYINSTNIPGATDSTLTIANADVAWAGDYSVAIRNSVGSIVTRDARLTIAPQIVTSPVSQTVGSGDVEFSVTATGSFLTYQWQFNGTNLPGEIFPTLHLRHVQPHDGGTYTVVISNSAGTVTEDVTLTVGDVPVRVLWDRHMTLTAPHHPFPPLAVDSTGNAYIVHKRGGSIFPTKYDPQGTTLWSTNFFDGFDTVSSDLVVDHEGNVIVTGFSYHWSGGSMTATTRAAHTLKFSPNGKLLWKVTRWLQPWTPKTSVATDLVGNIYVTDSSTIKYTPGGQIVWQTNGNFGVNLKTDFDNNLLVLANTNTSASGNDYQLTKYSSTGTELWRAYYNGSASGNDIPVELAVDPSGNTYVTGHSLGVGSGSDFATIKYSAEGVVEWVRRYNGSGNGDDSPSAMTFDSEGNIYVTGSSACSCGSTNFTTIKYNSAGDELWSARYDGPSRGDDLAKAITTDEEGNIYVAGNSERDFLIVKYSSSGSVIWTTRYDRFRDKMDSIVGIAVDSTGDIFVNGLSDEMQTTVKFRQLQKSRPTGAPTIVKGPLDTNIWLGDAGSLSVSATAGAHTNLQYQWFRNDLPIIGATQSALSFKEATKALAGCYSVMISNSVDVVSSERARLTLLARSDFNKDNFTDLLLQHTNGSISGWLFKHTNWLGSARFSPNQPSSWRLEGGSDFNKDGHTDLLWRNSGGSLALWLMNRTNRHAFLSIANGQKVTADWRLVGMADLNGDLKPDLLWQGKNGSVAVWMMNGSDRSGSVLVRGGQPAGIGWKAVGSGDFNGDSKADILFHHTTGKLAAWFMDGTNFLSAGNLRNGQPSPAGWRVVGLNDLNDDAESDILWQNSKGQIAIWFMNQTNFVSSALLLNGQPLAPGWRIIGVK